MDFSFQLYSARSFQPWDRVLNCVAELGYRQVEGFAGVYDDPQSFRRLMDDNGLSMPSGHFAIEALENKFDLVDEISGVLGISKIVCPYLVTEQRPSTSAGWRVIADRLSVIGKTVAASGRSFAWHNHDFEFHPTSDGETPMMILLEDASDMEWEADLAWVVRGGEDPKKWIDRYGDRITAVHLKDIAAPGECADEDGWADVGHGTVDWRQLTEALKSKTKCGLFIAEHDNPSDVARFAGRSIESMRAYLEPANV